MRVIGMISGTSYDAIEVAVADISLRDQTLTLLPLGAGSVAYPPSVREEIARLLPPNVTTIEAVCRLDTHAAQAFAEAAAVANQRFAEGRAEVVVSHGQTVFHWVHGSKALGTLQVGNPAWIAERTGLTVVSNLRSRDIAAGGQGAPLVSLFDVLLLSHSSTPVAAVNLGGISNMTVVKPGLDPIAYDIGPSNALIDAAIRHFSGNEIEFDEDGRAAARGHVSERLLTDLLADPYYKLEAPKSTGKEYFNLPYLLGHLSAAPGINADDVLATVTMLTAITIASECRRHSLHRVLASGGGTKNPTLMSMLKDAASETEFVPIESVGIPSSSKEAYAFALIGFLTVHGLPGIVASCTGATHASVLGDVTPGPVPLEVSRFENRMPTFLEIGSPVGG
jgi:anhydro-N-acetylmuramic acid kinase